MSQFTTSLLTFFCLLTMNVIKSQELVCKVGDTLSVFAKSGLNLRDQPLINSNVIARIPFGERVKVVELTYDSEIIENRKGLWLKVDCQEETGFLFSGYLTKLEAIKIGKNEANYVEFNEFISWLESSLKQDSIIDKQEANFSGYGKDGYRVDWNFYSNGTMVYHYYKYEDGYYVFESFDISLIDCLNYLEYCLSALESKYSREETYYKPIIRIERSEYDKSIKKIECRGYWNLVIEKVGVRTVCTMGLH